MPGKFRFKLQRVLDYRLQLEEQAKMELAKALAAHRQKSRQLDELRDTLSAHLASLDGKAQVASGELWLWRNYKRRLEQDIFLVDRELFQCAKRVNRCRQDLIGKAKEKKLLERLRETQKKTFLHEENMREQRESDEMATIRYTSGTL